MSFEAMAWAVKQTTANSRDKFVLLMLANFASGETGECYPSINRLAKDTQMGRKTIFRSIASLESGGFLEIRRRTKGGVNLPNIYCLAIDNGGVTEGPAVSQRDQGGVTATPGVVSQWDSNLSLEPINEPINKTRTREIDEFTRNSCGITLGDEFEEFWNLWPHKVGKPAARKKFLTARKVDDFETIMDGVRRYIRDKPPQQAWLNPATFLNQERWNDEPAPTGPPAQPRHGGKSVQQIIHEQLAEAENEQNSSDQGTRDNLVRLPVG